MLSDFPELSLQLNEELTGKSANDLNSKSGIIASWNCPLGHIWKARVFSRTKNNNYNYCPYCSNKKVLKGFNDLKTTNPALANFFDKELNNFSVEEITNSSTKNVWWKCELGHSWKSPVQKEIIKNNHCQFCAGRLLKYGENDLFTMYPKISNEIDKDLTNIDGSEISYNSSKEIPWKCAFGHRWVSPVRKRTLRNDGCPYCSKKRVTEGETDLYTTHPELSKEVCILSKYQARDVTSGSRKKILWICNKGHTWAVSPSNRIIYNTGCPKCSFSEGSSRGEKELLKFVQSLGVTTIANDRSVLKGKELDIYVPDKNIAFEYNGVYWHSEKFVDKNYTLEKIKSSSAAGVNLIIVWDDIWKNNPETIKDMVISKLDLYNVDVNLCSFAEIDKKSAKEFLNEKNCNSDRNKIFFGLYSDKKDLIAVTKWRKLNTSMYLDNYVIKCNFLNGLDKIISNIKNIYQSCITELIVFDDLETSNSEIYEKLGFVRKTVIGPDYSYNVNGNRIDKSVFTREYFKDNPNLIFDSSLSEEDLASLNKLYRVYDSGRVKYVMRLE